jgi:transcriptional regulator with XRE-family HTH domain
MVYVEKTTRRTVTADLAEVLAAARRRLGWTLREAAQNVGVSTGTIEHLEKARRAPSIVVARNIARAYQLSPGEADMLFAEAVEGAGKDSPFVYAKQSRRSGHPWDRALAAFSMVHGCDPLKP